MKYSKQLLLFVSLVFYIPTVSWGQCDQEQTITVCSMETIDFDTDGNPDGIINLYTETGTTLVDGVWTTDLNNSIALDSNNGNLAVWELRNASSNQTNYEFTLSNSACGDDPVLTVLLILGPYSGIALPPDDDDINFYICDTSFLDMSTVLVTNSSIPTAHINGTWSFVSNPFGGSLTGNIFSGSVAYQPGLPRVDQNVYELVYTVEGVAPCAPISQTFVKVAVVRQVSAGIPDNQEICESAIIAGDWDQDINVRDYLSEEDIEGFWNDDFNGNPSNLMINIRDLYNDITNNGNNPRFGCETFSYTYTVEKRSVVCIDDQSTVSFSIYEQLRPFQQNVFPELCPGKAEDPPTIVRLIDFIEFEPGFEYSDDALTSWEYISGPSELNLQRKRTTNEPFEDISGLRCSLDPAITNDNLEEPYYNPDGLININGARPGEYRFRYYVCSNITGCSNPCPDLETEVVIQILAEDHAGEDTSGLAFCITDGPIDMRSLLNTNGIDTVVETGTWTDADGTVVDNTFIFPDSIEGTQQEFTFTYSTVSADNCVDDADLTFTIFNEVKAGVDVDVTLCSDDLRVTLFDELTGNPDPTGTWIGPFGYTSPDHLGVFNPNDPTLPILGPGVYTYTVPGNGGCTSTDDSTVTISIVDPIEIGQDVNETFCILDGRVNLFSLLDRQTIRTGVFEDSENTGALTPEGVVEFDQLPNPDNLVNPVYNFRYVVPNQAPCDESSLNVAVQVIDLPEPEVGDQQFCILDAKRLDDIEVDVLNYNWYVTLESETPIIDNPLLFDNDIFYITNVDADNCESERVEVKIDILNTGERFDNGDLCTLDFQDGVSPDGNNQNDTFALFIEDVYNIPVAFPDFELKIFNRYGTPVFEGNINTEEFRGESNISVRLGDDLPSGTYFYIFTPNFDNNLPIQGSFYLAR